MTQSSPVDQNRMPYLESLVAERNRWQTSFHMPGHKGRMEVHPLLTDYLGGNPLPADLVEINGIIDYLHSPKGALLEAQQLAAAAYGADQTFFLINGSTVGNEGAVMSVSGAGQKVIMSRASHRSVYGGVVLSGAMPIYAQPAYHPEVGYPLGIQVESIQDLLEANDNVAAVHITSPNYYGVQSDTRAIADVAHENGAALLVDEAHGSHLHFHEALPPSATTLGADLVVQSTHKTQGALTQASMLHYNATAGIVNPARVGQVLSLLQSSSPSSILLATLDFARMQMVMNGRDLLDKIIELADDARQQIRKLDGLWCYGDDLIGTYGIHNYDPTKLIIRVTEAGYTGFEAYEILRQKYGIDAEFSDLRQVICSLTIGDTRASVNKLLDALREMSRDKRDPIVFADEVVLPAELPKIHISPRDAYFAPSVVVKLEDAVGEIVAENIIPYPPGIPLLVPGEVLEAQHLEYLRYIMSKGSGIVGTEDKTMQTLRIVVG